MTKKIIRSAEFENIMTDVWDELPVTLCGPAEILRLEKNRSCNKEKNNRQGFANPFILP